MENLNRTPEGSKTKCSFVSWWGSRPQGSAIFALSRKLGDIAKGVTRREGWKERGRVLTLRGKDKKGF